MMILANVSGEWPDFDNQNMYNQTSLINTDTEWAIESVRIHGCLY